MKLERMYWEKDGNVARLTLARPDLLNAMDYQGTVDLCTAAEAIRDDPDIRLVVIRGEGRAFCTGIDLKQLSAGETPPGYYENWDRALRIFETMEKFVISAMQGYALGGGLQIALASDIRIATEDCQLGLPAIQESIVPGLSVYRLPRFIGLGRAKWMVLSGENVSGRRAFEIGLVDQVVPPDALGKATETAVDGYLATCSEGARHSKVLLGLHSDMAFPEFFEEYLRRQAICMASPDHMEAQSAYRAKRRPIWG